MGKRKFCHEADVMECAEDTRIKNCKKINNNNLVAIMTTDA